MRRRDLIAAASALLLPRVIRAQQPGRQYRVGFTAPTSGDAPQWRAVLDELARSGFVGGKNLIVDRRGLAAKSDQLDAVILHLPAGVCAEKGASTVFIKLGATRGIAI